MTNHDGKSAAGQQPKSNPTGSEGQAGQKHPDQNKPQDKARQQTEQTRQGDANKAQQPKQPR